MGGIQPQTVAFGENGSLDLDAVKSVIKEDDFHFARTRLLCLENTQHGRVQAVEYMQTARKFAHDHNLQIHLDGARMANAATSLGVSLKEIAQCFDSVSLCLSKGLGAPIGSLLFCSKPFIQEACRWRKVTGGGMRQIGMLAAAGKVALTDGFNRMQEDHDNAQYLAQQLEGIAGVNVRQGWTQTNMVWLEFSESCGEALGSALRESGVLVSQVRSVKAMGSRHFVLIDAGFNDLMRPSMYGSYHHITALAADGRDLSAAPLIDTVVAGPLCESGDVFTQQEGGKVETRALSAVVPGDYLVLHDTGAYGASMSSNYNSRPLLPEVLFDGGVARLIRRRQTIEELLALELL